MPLMSGGAAIVESILAQGVKTVFGLPGGRVVNEGGGSSELGNFVALARIVDQVTVHVLGQVIAGEGAELGLVESKLVIANEDDATVLAREGGHVVKLARNAKTVIHERSLPGDHLVSEVGRQIEELGLVGNQGPVGSNHSLRGPVLLVSSQIEAEAEEAGGDGGLLQKGSAAWQFQVGLG